MDKFYEWMLKPRYSNTWVFFLTMVLSINEAIRSH